MKKRSSNRMLLTILLCCNFCFGQKSYIIQTVAFYNLENLFDTINDPNKLDELSPMMEIKNNRTSIYKDKLKKLASVITQIGTKKNQQPPALIGVAEVENKKVLSDLINTPQLQLLNYGIVHFDSPDKRGIDTALLYNKKVFKPTFSEAIPAKLYKDGIEIYTRDILHLTGYLLNEKIHILVNHWPSRRGGAKKSSILRERVAYRNLTIIKKILEDEPTAKIISMGDFNDNPTNKSFKKVLNTRKSKKKLDKQELYNPYEKLYKKGHYSLVYRGDLFLFDQIYFTENLVTAKKNYEDFKFYKAGIFNPSFLTEENGKDKGGPKRSFVNSTYTGGYSDHYPVYIYLIKENSKK